MNKKRIIYISLIAIIFGAIALYLIYSNTNSTNNKELSDFSIKDTSSITRIFLSDMNKNSVKVVKIKSGEWLVNDKYPARNDNLISIFKTLIWIEVREPVPEKHLEQVNALLAAMATKVEIYQTVYRINLFNKIKLFPYEKRTKTFFVGEATADQMGTYMLMDKSTKPFITYLPGFRGFLSSRFSCRENDWRIPRIFNAKLGEIKSIAVDFIESPEESFKITNNNNDRTFTLFASNNGLKKIDSFDTLNVLNYMSSFENINFEAILNHISKKDSIIKSAPFHVITLESFSGNIQKIKTFHKWSIETDEINTGDNEFDRDRLYALINDGNDLVLIQFYVFDKIFKPLSYFKEIKN